MDRPQHKWCLWLLTTRAASQRVAWCRWRVLATGFGVVLVQLQQITARADRARQPEEHAVAGVPRDIDVRVHGENRNVGHSAQGDDEIDPLSPSAYLVSAEQ